MAWPKLAASMGGMRYKIVHMNSALPTIRAFKNVKQYKAS